MLTASLLAPGQAGNELSISDEQALEQQMLMVMQLSKAEADQAATKAATKAATAKSPKKPVRSCCCCCSWGPCCWCCWCY